MKSKTLDSHPQVHYPLKLYTDGGVIFKNPSPYGVTCAWALVENEHLIRHESYISVFDGLTTNNQSELLAIVFGLESLHFMDRKAVVEVCSDSEVSLMRVFGGSSMSNVPQRIQDRLLNVKDKLINWDKFSYTLLGGHPTKISLKKGTNAKRQPVSRWNVFCDDLCQKESQRFMMSVKENPDEHR